MSRIFSPSQWIAVISLFSLSALLETSGQAAPAGGAGPPPADGHQTSKPGKSGTANNNAAPPRSKPDLRPMPREQTPLEERLQRGQMEEAVAQGQVSDRLEQLHKGLPEETR